jgi:amidase
VNAPHPELAEATIDGLAADLAAGRITAAELVEAHIARIEALDRAGPTLRSVIELNPDAVEIARTLDRERAAGRVRGPLHGIPVMVKDNVDTGDRMQTTAGSLALVGPPAGRDAPLVARLREAGAVLLGKTNLSEWANFRSPASSSGWSGRGRQTRNPYVLDRTPGGSSSGSGAAPAAGLAVAAVGTETDGSIVSPSAACCLVGLKPTVGVVSGEGVIPISASQDSAGPMARTVRDAALLLDAMLGSSGDHAAACAADGLRGARIGVLREPWMGANRHADRVYEAALEAMREAGAELVDPVQIDTAEELRTSDCELTVLLYEFKDGLNRYLAARPDAGVRTLADVIEFNLRHADLELPYFGQETFERAEAMGPVTDDAYREALALGRRLTREQGIDACLAGHALDALTVPCSNPPAAIELVSPGRGWTAGGLGASKLAAIAGYPIISVPAGFAFGDLPVGMRLFAGAGSERTLLRLASGFERATSARRSPRYLPTLDLP